MYKMKGGYTMARCYYLDYKSTNCLSRSGDEWTCTKCGKRFGPYDTQVKYTCNAEYGNEFEKCPIYRSR